MAERKTATQLAFDDYVRFITVEFLNKYARSYDNADTVRGSWRVTYPYSADAVQLLIDKSTLFLRTMDCKDANSTCPHLLNALTTLMADYLAPYVMRGDAEYETAPRKEVRNRAKAKMKDALYNNSSYIQGLLAAQAQRRAARQFAGRKYAQQKHQTEYAQRAQVAYRTSCEVRDIFRDANNYKKY